MNSELLDAISIDRILEDTRYIAEETAWRIAGSEMERKAANYIARQMREAGATVELYEIDAYISFPARCDGRGSQPRASHYQGQRFRSGCSDPCRRD